MKTAPVNATYDALLEFESGVRAEVMGGRIDVARSPLPAAGV